MISIIIPYKDHPERRSLLDAVRKRIRDLWIRADGLEVVISEQKNDAVFHRAWVLNKGARMSEGDLLIFMDGDLIVPAGYFSMIDEDHPSVGWRRMLMARPETTKMYIDDLVGTDALKASAMNFRKPNMNCSAGGITIIERDLFFKLKGFPEDFKGTWGGEDNTFWYKLEAFGYEFRTVNADVIHLYHEQRTPRRSDIHEKHHQMSGWTKEKWQQRLNEIGDDWGK